MKKNNLITLLKIIKDNREILEKQELELDLNELLKLSEKEIEEILKIKNIKEKLWKLILITDNSNISNERKEKFFSLLKIKDITTEEFFNIYNSLKEINPKIRKEEDYDKYILKLKRILQQSKEDFTLKYSVKALSNFEVFISHECDMIIDYILFSKEKHQALYGYLMTVYPNIMKNDKKIDILRIITSTTTKEQAENTLKTANNKDTQKHKFYLDILEKISRAYGKYQSMYGYLASTELKILNNKYFLYMLDLITTSKEDFQAETMYRLLQTDMVYRKDCIELLEIIKGAKSKYHASSTYKLINDICFINRKKALETLTIINTDAENKNQVLYSCQMIKALNELGINDSNLEKAVLLFVKENDVDKLKCMYELVEIYPRIPQTVFIRILKMMSKCQSKEEAYKILKVATDDALLNEDDYYNKVKTSLKEQKEDYVEIPLEEIMNINIDELIEALNSCKEKEVYEVTNIKVKKHKLNINKIR